MSNPQYPQKAEQAVTERSSWLQIPVSSKQKAGWVRAAQAEGMKLAAWVVKTLDAAVRKP